MPAKTPSRLPALPLRALREAANKTQAEMAEVLGMDQGSVSRLERRASVETDALRAYAEALGYSCRIVFVRDDARGVPTRRNMVVAELVAPASRSKIVKSSPNATSTSKPHVDPRRLERLCQEHHIKRLSLFGSVVRDDFAATSDVDVLYEPEAGHLGTLSSITAAAAALEGLFGRRVDFVKRSLIENSANVHRRRSILEDERKVYDEGRVNRAQLARALA